MAFDFKRHLIKVQGRDYLPVSARILWFRQEHPDWGIHTEPIEINHEKQYAVFRAIIYNAEGKLMAMGTKKEDVKGFGDYLEKSETGAIGRALALCGFGTQFSPEFDEMSRGRPADSPQFRGHGGYDHSEGGSRYSSPPVRANIPIREKNESPDFDTMINSSLEDATEENPFGNEKTAVGTDTLAVALTNDVPACHNCGKALTKAQQEISIRNYGEALCPACQKEKSRRPAMADR